MRDRELVEFVDLHAGETAWLFGKGPSLDKFRFADAGPLRVGINDLVGVVPDCMYGFSNDQITRWEDVYSPGQVLFQPYRTTKDYTPAADCDLCVYRDDPHVPLVRSKAAMADCLQVRDGTLGSAMQVLYLMGVREIVAVGIDGGNSHAGRNKWRTSLKNEHYRDYNLIKHQFIEGCRKLGISLKFFREDGIMSTGMKYVIFNKSCLVRGIHHDEGSIAELPEMVAREAVQVGCAEFTRVRVFKEPKQVETAAVEVAVEVPERRVVRSRRRKGTSK